VTGGQFGWIDILFIATWFVVVFGALACAEWLDRYRP